jgi:hypothetical protein
MNLRQLQETIDRTIKEVWIEKIPNDYQSYYLLMEDSLKNALYFHLRTRLSNLLDSNNIRIYPEYHYKDCKADLAIVKLNDNPGKSDHLRDDVASVLAINEIKYKSGSSIQPFEDDIQKIKKYVDMKPNDDTQYYLAFVHEAEYEFNEEDSWLTAEQQEWAKGRLTELSGNYIEGQDEISWQVLSHNGFNPDFRPGQRISKNYLIEAAKGFNEEKYSKELYHHLLEVVKNARSVTPELREAVKYLLYWKLGKISTKRTPASEPLVLDGCHYYVSGTTPSNKKAIENALTEAMLQSGLQFRDNQITYESFRVLVNTITVTSIVLPTFYIHIWNPDEYPILDVKVWHAYKWNRGELVKKHTKPNSWSHYEEYTAFFNNLVIETGLDWRTVDKGLWAIGEEVLRIDLGGNGEGHTV